MAKIKFERQWNEHTHGLEYVLTSKQPMNISAIDKAIEDYCYTEGIDEYDFNAVGYFGHIVSKDMQEIEGPDDPPYRLVLHDVTFQPDDYCPFCGALTEVTTEQVWEEAFARGYEACLNGDPAPKGVSHE